MSNLFVDMHRSRQRQRTYQNNTPPTSTSTATTTSESASSTQLINNRKLSHHKKSSMADAEDAARNANYNINNQKAAEDDKYDSNNDDTFANILSLKLKKPKHWKWELSTSKSCSNIALPRILLYDHKGKLLIDAQGANEGVYKQEDYKNSKQEKPSKRSYLSKDQTTNLTHSIRRALEKDFNGLQIQEVTPSPKSNSPLNISSYCRLKAIDFNTTDLPDYGLSRRSSSLIGVRFNVKDNVDEVFYDSHIPEFLPTPPSTTTPTSSSSGPREKRKYRRSQSSSRSSAHSESILERFSYLKGRSSSPEYAEEIEIENAPRYFLRTCNAGTLVVKEDSFNLHPRRRRRPLRHRSTESLLSMKKTLVAVQNQSACRSPTISEMNCSGDMQQKEHYLGRRKILLNQQLSTSSDEDIGVVVGPKILSDNSKHLRKYSQVQNKAKGDINYSADVHQTGKVR